MANPRKPTQLKVIAGTVQKCRLIPNEAQGRGGMPEAPAWLSSRAAEIFYDTCASMDGMRTLSAEWCDVIAHYASAVEEVEVTTGIIEDLGRVYTTTTVSGDTMFRPRPEVAMRSDAMKRAQALRSEIGLGPASKSKVSAKPDADANPFKALSARA